MPKEINFAIKDKSGYVSSVWKLFISGDEFYMLQRGSLSTKVKFSFHKSGACRWAQIDPQKNGIERGMMEWHRPQLHGISENDVIPILALGFPSNHLTNVKDGNYKKVIWLPSASIGKATLVQVFITKNKKEEVKVFQGPISLNHIYSESLRSGGFVHLTYQFFECGVIEKKMPAEPIQEKQVFGDLVFPDDPHIRERPINMGVLYDAKPTPIMWDLHGYEASTLAEIKKLKTL